MGEHQLNCQKSLDTCKERFSNDGCLTRIKYSKLELEETIKTTERSMKENESIFEQIKILEISTKKDCEDITNFFNDSKTKLDSDIKFVNNIQKEIRDKIVETKLAEVKRKKDAIIKAKKDAEAKIKQDAINKAKKDAINKAKKDGLKKTKQDAGIKGKKDAVLKKNTTIKKTNVTTKITSKKINELPKKNATISQVKKVEKEKKILKEGKKDDKKKDDKKKDDKKKDDKKVKKSNVTAKANKTLNKTVKPLKFIEYNSNLFTNFVEKIKGFFSFVQLKSNKNNVMTFTEIDEKLKNLKTAEEKINLLVTSQREFKVVLKSLKDAVKIFFKSGKSLNYFL